MAAGKRTAKGPERYAAPVGCAQHEKESWLPELSLPFLKELRSRHVELAQDWARAVDQIAAVRDEATDAEAACWQAVRETVAASEAPPPRPFELDSALTSAKVAVAVEDAQRARDDLGV